MLGRNLGGMLDGAGPDNAPLGLAADGTIHAGMRFDLLGVDYGGTEWGLPLLEQAARDILAIDSSSSTIQRILSMMKSVGNGGFAIDSPSN